MLSVGVSPYWSNHDAFGRFTKSWRKVLTNDMVMMVILYAVVPVLYAYGKISRKETYCDRAFDILEDVKVFAEKTSSTLRKYGVNADRGREVMALRRLVKEYCLKGQCLRCRLGYQFIKNNV